MFSVASSPYNSLPRQLYGGWTTNITPDTADATAAGWNADGSQYFQDTKWASMAEKYATDPGTRDLAAHIRAISKNVLKNKRALAKAGDASALGWVAAYNAAAKNTRSKLRLPPLSYASKNTIWNKFRNLRWNDDFSDPTRAWFALASRAPYISAPTVPGLAPADIKPFVTSSASYALPEKMSLSTRELLALARSGNAIGTAEAASQAAAQAYAAALATPGGNAMIATQIARSIDPTFNPPVQQLGNVGV